MRIPSRRMAPASDDSGEMATSCAVLLLVFFSALVALVVAGCWHSWTMRLGCVAWLGIAALLGVFDHRKRRRLLDRRVRDGLGICTFAREFPRRSVDTWILRATWEELGTYLAVDGRPFPIRADDRLDAFGLDDLDLEDVVVRIAGRARRTLYRYAANPWTDRVETIQDLVDYLQFQPRIVDGTVTA